MGCCCQIVGLINCGCGQLRVEGGRGWNMLTVNGGKDEIDERRGGDQTRENTNLVIEIQTIRVALLAILKK